MITQKGGGMFASTDVLTVIFGSLGGIAALVMAINTLLLRREAKIQEATKEKNNERMNLFETSQTSLQAALTRADTENERLRKRIANQEKEITTQAEEIRALKVKVTVLELEVEELKHAR